MSHSSLRYGDCKYMMEMLVLECAQSWWQFHEGDTLFLDGEAEKFLDQAEVRAAGFLLGRQEPTPNIHYGRLQRALAAFYYDRVEDSRYGLDYNIKLSSRERMVSEETYPWIFR